MTRTHLLLVLTAALSLGGCAALPESRVIPRQGVQWIQATDPNCIPPSGEEALRAAVGDDAKTLAFARTVGSVESLLQRAPLLAGNQVDLLVDGPATHAAQLEAIRSAQHHVHLDVYILTDEALGKAYAEALKDRARAGVKVRLIFDAIGGMGAGFSFREALKDAGVEIHEFNTVNTLKDPRLWRLNRRSHRKLLVVDGRVAFTGGINITDEYSEASPAAGSSGASQHGGWRDTHIRVAGPAVAEFQRAFIAGWEAEKRNLNLGPEYFPHLKPEGSSIVRVVTNEGTDFLQLVLDIPQDTANKVLRKQRKKSDIYASYLTAIRESKQKLWVAQAYFAPNDEFLKQLKKAAQRGVDVRLLLPAESDVGLLTLASRSYYDELLDAGVRLYEYQPVMMHAKTAVIDGVWSTVGSSNLDFRSFIHNDEANAVILGREFGGKMEQQFLEDLQQSKEILPKEWRERPLTERLKEQAAAAIKFWI